MTLIFLILLAQHATAAALTKRQGEVQNCIVFSDGKCYSRWKCSEDTSIHGFVNIDWGHTSADASWACKQWNRCGQAAECTAQSASFEILEDDAIQGLVKFMTSNVDDGTSGGAYVASSGELAGKLLPLSFYVTPQFFGDFVCKHGPTATGVAPDCAVTDEITSDPYAIKPSVSVGGDLQIERMNIKYGMNIYDSACWQIAMALIGERQNDTLKFELASNIDLMLNASHFGNDPAPKQYSFRAKPTEAINYYNNLTLAPQNSLAFRMWPREYEMTDILIGTSYQDYIQNAQNSHSGNVTWADFKPVMGENAWAFFIGPLQSLYLKDVVHGGQMCVNFNDLAIQNAINVLPAIQAMQSPIGGVYYAPKGSLGNTGSDPSPPYSVSTENNASLFAGLSILKSLLQDLKDKCGLADSRVDDAIWRLECILKGGSVEGNCAITSSGMFSFFTNQAWNPAKGLFGTGGFAYPNGTWQSYEASDPNTAQAVDVNTWTIASLGVSFVDKVVTKTFGSAFMAWEATKKFGAYYNGDTLIGVGYSDTDRKQPGAENGVVSAEWSFGALNLVRTLIAQYSMHLHDSSMTADNKTAISQYVAQLRLDEQQMASYINELRTDKFDQSSALSGVRSTNISDYQQIWGMSQGQVAYLYASNRFQIPFGWSANPIPSTTSSSWAVYSHYGYNPFVLGGQYASKNIAV